MCTHVAFPSKASNLAFFHPNQGMGTAHPAGAPQLLQLLELGWKPDVGTKCGSPFPHRLPHPLGRDAPFFPQKNIFLHQALASISRSGQEARPRSVSQAGAEIKNPEDAGGCKHPQPLVSHRLAIIPTN